MRKLSALLFSLLVLTVSVAVLAPGKVFAATCADGTTVADPDPKLGSEDKTAFIQSECAAHGGTKQDFAAGCRSDKNFLSMPTWYKYLKSDQYTDPVDGQQSCHPKLEGISDVWKVVAAVIEILLRVASLIAIGFIVYGGILYTISQSSPDKTKQALKTIINALVGLVITIIATAVVSFIAGSFK